MFGGEIEKIHTCTRLVDLSRIAMQLSIMSFGSITLLEMNAISSGATSKSGAMIREFYQIDFLIEMAKESKKFFEQSDINFIKNGRIYLFS